MKYLRQLTLTMMGRLISISLLRLCAKLHNESKLFILLFFKSESILLIMTEYENKVECFRIALISFDFGRAIKMKFILFIKHILMKLINFEQSKVFSLLNPFRLIMLAKSEI